MIKELKRGYKVFFERLCKKYGIAAFIVFGSSATGKTNKLSDIDIAYLPQKKLAPTKENALFVEVIEYLRRDDVDLVDLTKTSLILKYSAINLGKVIACIDEKQLYDFVIITRREYLDTAYLRDLFYRYTVKRIKSGRFGGANEKTG